MNPNNTYALFKAIIIGLNTNHLVRLPVCTTFVSSQYLYTYIGTLEVPTLHKNSL